MKSPLHILITVVFTISAPCAINAQEARLDSFASGVSLVDVAEDGNGNAYLLYNRYGVDQTTEEFNAIDYYIVKYKNGQVHAQHQVVPPHPYVYFKDIPHGTHYSIRATGALTWNANESRLKVCVPMMKLRADSSCCENNTYLPQYDSGLNLASARTIDHRGELILKNVEIYNDSLLFIKFLNGNTYNDCDMRYNLNSHQADTIALPFRINGLGHSGAILPMDAGNVIFGVPDRFYNAHFSALDFEMLPSDSSERIHPTIAPGKFYHLSDSLFLITATTNDSLNWGFSNESKLLHLTYSLKSNLLDYRFLHSNDSLHELAYEPISVTGQGIYHFFMNVTPQLDCINTLGGYCKNESKLWCMKTDHAGNVQWKKHLPDTGYLYPQGIHTLSSGNHALTYTRWDYLTDSTKLVFDLVITEINSNGEVVGRGVLNSQEIRSYQVYPNPVSPNEKLHVRLQDAGQNNMTLKAAVYSINGKAMRPVNNLKWNNGELSFNLGAATKPGAYILKVSNGQQVLRTVPFVVK